MADETKVEEKIEAVVEAVAAPVKAVAETIEKAVEATAAKVAPAKAAPAKAKKVVRTRRVAKAPAKVAVAAKKISKRVAKPVKRVRKAAPAAAAKTIEGIKTMTYDFNQLFAGFQVPAADKFNELFADANEKGQAFVAKSQKAAEEWTDIAKANVEAIVEAGKIAAKGARTIGQDVLATGREGVEQASDAVKTLAEAKSPTEFFQIQSELARASFDRLVAESSKLTERMVKLAGETVEPLQTRASLNAERVNSLVA